MKRIALTLGLLVLAVVSIACSPASGANPPATNGPLDPNAPVVVAQNNVFAPATVNVESGKAFSLTLDNKDAAPHNVAIFKDASAAEKISIGEIVSSSIGDPAGPGAREGPVLLPVRRAQGDDRHDRRGVVAAPSPIRTTTPRSNARGRFDSRAPRTPRARAGRLPRDVPLPARRSQFPVPSSQFPVPPKCPRCEHEAEAAGCRGGTRQCSPHETRRQAIIDSPECSPDEHLGIPGGVASP